MKECLITVKGFQDIDGENDYIEVKAIGKIHTDAEKTVIVYHEEQSVGEDVRVIIKYIPDTKLFIERTGGLENNIILEKKKRNMSFYTMPYSTVLMGFYCEEIGTYVENSAYTIFARYQMDIDGNVVSRNKIKIIVEEV